MVLGKFPHATNGAAGAVDSYQGDVVRATSEEKFDRASIYGPVFSEGHAVTKNRGIDRPTGFRIMWGSANASRILLLRNRNSQESTRFSISKVKEHLYTTCKSIATKWYIDNERIRRSAPPSLREFTALGVKGSGAINSELKRWARGLTHIHESSSRLNLLIFQISRLLSPPHFYVQ